ncbi:unnamed protein product [Peronospora destructor]|uniref:CST complex subunit STN1 n=1 Tax=Peronospora destructor TaxID=86335 RepID=A0AAV0T457_9STRA|nr:unnamed protein product [Peronospora destructor]
MRDLGKDPLTWSFVKLFGVHVDRELLEFKCLPRSHAWQWKSAGLWRARLLTKAQCIGVVVSIVLRANRVEILVDDGTAFIKTVLWGEGVQLSVVLGDLVHVEGKLNIDKNWDAVELPRELRIFRITKVVDPNEELLHWIQVMELAQTYYSAASGSCGSQDKYSNGAKSETIWEDIAAGAFFSLCISVSMKQKFLSRSDRGRYDETLLETLESLLLLQNGSDTKEPVSITFSDYISSTGLVAMAGGHDKVTDKNQRIRALQYTFRELRRAGLLFLQDDAADRHVLLSFEAALKPALLQLLQVHSQGCSIAGIADAILTRERFTCIPLQWIMRSLEHLLACQLVVQKKKSQLFYLLSESSPTGKI